MSKKTPTKRKKTDKPLFIPYAPSKPVPAYSRADIESILTNIMLVSVSLAAFLLTLTMFIAVLKH